MAVSVSLLSRLSGIYWHWVTQPHSYSQWRSLENSVDWLLILGVSMGFMSPCVKRGHSLEKWHPILSGDIQIFQRCEMSWHSSIAKLCFPRLT